MTVILVITSFLLMAFLWKITEIYLQLGSFLESLITTLNKQTKGEDWPFYYFHSSTRGVFRTLLSI